MEKVKQNKIQQTAKESWREDIIYRTTHGAQ